MTEADWLTGSAPLAMLDCEQMDEASARKLRLFACACLRRMYELEEEWDDGEPDSVLAVAERYADDPSALREANAARSQLGARGGYSSAWALSNARHRVLDLSAGFAAQAVAECSADLRPLTCARRRVRADGYVAGRSLARRRRRR